MPSPRLSRAFGLALSLLLAACTFQFNTRVEEDGAGALRTEIGFDFFDQQGLSGLGLSPEEFCRDLQTGEGLPVDAPITVEERGSEVWCIVTFAFQDLAELQEIYANMGGVAVNELTLTDTEFVYDVDLEFTGTEAGDIELPEIPITFRWQVTLPGLITDHNADEADGNTLSWEMSLGQAVNVHARSDLTRQPVAPLLPGQDGGSRVPVLVLGLLGLCCCTALVGALGAGAFFLLRRRPASPPPPA
jgi:hypothetical protein